MKELMNGLFSGSEILVLNFDEIDQNDAKKNIQQYFQQCISEGLDPKTSEHREKFNIRTIRNINNKYLIGRYLEDRSSMLEGSHIFNEGRVYHLAIDIFAEDREEIYAPISGEIVRSNHEDEDHGYGHYLIFRPENKELPYIFLGHLSEEKVSTGKVREGQRIASLGGHHENGGWSTHLHLQLLWDLPEPGSTPIGYSTLEDLEENKRKFPDPTQIFPDWKIQR